MDARKLIPSVPATNPQDFPRNVASMRHPYTKAAIGESFWLSPQPKDFTRFILPVRPDNVPGRIAQQSSCFTLHIHQAKNEPNETLGRIKIPKTGKEGIRTELTRLNVSQFSIFADLDHLSKDIKSTWVP
jgi:hypothetical protein